MRSDVADTFMSQSRPTTRLAGRHARNRHFFPVALVVPSSIPGRTGDFLKILTLFSADNGEIEPLCFVPEKKS